ncbi:DMT family transporter [Pseudooctadecabacter jejudonensis]|uniref:DMT family transporter n=1 Tax=Pseudooctadecabacter jejudonensis TaxID=1391910 RepID=UPI000A271AF9|nr:DMT family transporter [Pseudooctadecabacter jejudonensis]
MTRADALPWVALILFGAGWGIMQPLTKIAVSGGFEPFGIMVWQGVASLVLGGLLSARYGPPRGRWQWLFCAQVAVLGTLIPHFASFTAIAHLPAGLMAIIMALIPIFALLMGGVIGLEPVTARRALGIGCGLAAIAVIAATHGDMGTDLGTGPLWAVGVAVVAPLCYATNSTLTSARGLYGMHPLQALAGSALLFLPVATGGAVITGQLKGLGADLPSLAVAGSVVGHTLIYAGFLWLIARSGAVFASQTAYLVTGFGVLWSMVLLGERYALAIWLALALMLAGLSLVRPRATGDTGTN